MIHPQLTYDGFGDADIIVEAVFENMALKKQIFAEIDRIAKAECVLASNTSTLDIDEIACARRGRTWSSGCISSVPRTSCGWSKSSVGANR